MYTLENIGKIDTDEIDNLLLNEEGVDDEDHFMEEEYSLRFKKSLLEKTNCYKKILNIFKIKYP